MKKIFVSILIILSLLANIAYGENIIVEQSINCTENCSISNVIVVNATDGKAREAVQETQKDIYGTSNTSTQEDMALQDPLFLNQTKIKEICEYATIFDLIGEMPPVEFIAYVKSLGYDDETHITMIWTMCHEEYIKQHEGIWSKDIVGGGISISDVVSLTREAVNWLISKANNWLNHGSEEIIKASDQAKQFGEALDKYFASDLDIFILKKQINDLNIRIKFLEKTMEKIASEAYCQGKIDTMLEYNLSLVKCGEKTTYYHHVNPNQYHGFTIIGITPVEAKVETIQNVSQNLIADISIINLRVEELREGENASAFITVKNLGNGTGSTRVFLEIPKGWNYEPGEINLTLEPEQEKTVEFLVQVPSEAEESTRITGLITFVMGDEKVERGQAKDVKIIPKLTPVQSLTGYATLIFTYPPYLAILLLAIVAFILQIVNMKFQKPIKRRGTAFFQFWKKKTRKKSKLKD